MKALIIDDDDDFFIKQFVPQVELLMQTTFKEYTVDIINENFTSIKRLLDYDIIFLDIDLSNEYVNGLRIATNIKERNENALVIFVSNRVGLVHRTLAVQPTYFIRKNNTLKDMEVLTIIINRIFKRRLDTILFEYMGRKTSLKVSEIIYAESLGHNVILHTIDNTYEFRSNFQSLLKKFDHVKFTRIHKSYVININKVLEIRKNDICLENNIILPIGRKYKATVLDDYKESLLYDI